MTNTVRDSSISAPHPKRWSILFVVLAAECMDLLDGTVVNVAAPSIHRDLHTSSTALQWIVGGYALALAVGLLVGARLGDIHGRRRIFLLGAAGFTAASAVCAASPSTGILICSRLVQGTAAAMMVPQGLGILREVFPPDELPKAFGLFGPVMGSAAMLGPILGGGLIALDPAGAQWRTVFLINIPLGALAILGAARLVPRTGGTRTGSLDSFGSVAAAAAALAIIYPLIQGRELGWPAWTYASMAGGVILFAGFVLHLRRRVRHGREPLVQPSIFAHRGYSAGVLVMFLYFGGMVGASLAITLFLQLGEAFSPVHAGLTLAPFALGTALAAPVAGTRMTRAPARPLIQAGGLVSLVGYAGVALILTSATHASTWTLIGPLLVAGVGCGLFIVPIFDTILAAVTDGETGSASGVLNAMQQLGGAAGVALLGTIFFSVLGRHGFVAALRITMWSEVGLLVAMLALSPLLPRHARTEGPAVAVVADRPPAPVAAARTPAPAALAPDHEPEPNPEYDLVQAARD